MGKTSSMIISFTGVKERKPCQLMQLEGKEKKCQIQGKSQRKFLFQTPRLFSLLPHVWQEIMASFELKRKKWKAPSWR